MLEVVWRSLFALLLLVLGLPAHGQDYVVERAWLEDASGRLDLAEVRQRPVRFFTGVLSQGFGHSAIWLRLRIDPGAHPFPLREPERLVLRIRPTYLDDIRVFDPLAPRGLAGETGDLHHPGLSAFGGLDFLLPVARGSAPRDLWLRLASTSTRQIDVQVLDVDDLGRLGRTQALVFAGYLGLILVFASWGVAHWIASREQVIGAFGLKQTAALLYALGSLGYLRAFWPPDWPAWALDRTTTASSIAAVSTAILFHVLLQREFGPPRWIRRVHLALLALFPVKLALLSIGSSITALRLNMIEVLLAPVIFLCSALVSRGWSVAEVEKRPALSRPVVIGFYGVLVAMMVVAALPGLGLVQGGEISLYVVQAHGLLTAFLVLTMLQYRTHVRREQQRATTLALERSRLQARQEREIREERDKLLTMLAHELKTPLATMQMRLDTQARGSREIRLAIRDMDGVIERCLQTTRMDEGRLVMRCECCDLVDLVREAVSACAQPARVRMDMPGALRLRTDRQLFFVVLNNLLENACKYAAPDTPIDVVLQCDADGRGATLEVRNRPGAAGWPDANRLFDKYYRSPHARRQAGTGLGLFLARNLMQTLGGQIRYAPDDEQLRFVVTLPIPG